MATPPDLHRMYHTLKHKYLRVLLNNPDTHESIHEKIWRLRYITARLSLFDDIHAQSCFLVHIGNQRDLVEFAMLSPFESVEDLARGLETLFPEGSGSRTKDEDHFDSNHDSQARKVASKLVPDSRAHRVVECEYTHEDGTAATANNYFDSDSSSSESEELEHTTDPTELEPLSSERSQEWTEDITRENENKKYDKVGLNHTITTPNTETSEPGELLFCVGGASVATQEDVQEPFAGNVGQSDDFSSSGHTPAITIRQNYAPWDEPPREGSRISRMANPALEQTGYHCLTQGYAGRGSSHLRLHRGRSKVVGRWALGSEIKYSIDYKSFLSKGRSRDDADYALRSLQTALEVWNCHDVGIKFQYVEPKTSPIVFHLKYRREPWNAPHDVRHSSLAMSFFPVDTEATDRHPCSLYVFSAAFDISLRPHMMRAFLHKGAHILGGRHEDAATAERDDPSVQIGGPNNLSVLVTNRDPSAISLHWQDIKWFHEFMRLPEGHKLNGYPICDITP
ncbi:hypothetical protein NUW58_g1494 [Xylaria curta]|uniref:Uncharacterized protein n=1 Tax=Xylaria curta TaxID=42375 RepID=A0ACC1PMX6_9PEZI|nr:hypothetical protein NUW58_g1494 [Xylaria curta]